MTATSWKILSQDSSAMPLSNIWCAETIRIPNVCFLRSASLLLNIWVINLNEGNFSNLLITNSPPFLNNIKYTLATQKCSVLLKETGKQGWASRVWEGKRQGEWKKRKRKEKQKTHSLSFPISHHCHAFFSLFGSISNTPNLSTSFHLGYLYSSLNYHLILAGAFQ